MVYCGKPSRGCQMCRTRRIKCDETKPTCNQCKKSRRQCPGYKDDFDIVFRNETKATERRARRGVQFKEFGATHSKELFLDSLDEEEEQDDPKSLIISTYDSRDGLPGYLAVPTEDQAPCFFISNFVRMPRDASSRGSFDFLVPIIKTEKPDSHISIAFSAVALAALANRPSARGSGLMLQAFSQYGRALKAVNIALQNPAQQKTDATLASIILLGFFESITAEKSNVMAWGSHIDGAAQLTKMRGRKQLRTKTGLALFLSVRQQMLINCMSHSKPPQASVEWWIPGQDVTRDGPGITVTRIMLRLAESRYEVNTLLAASPRTSENFERVLQIMKRCQAMDHEFVAWEETLPEEWRYKTVAWVDHVPGGDLLKAEVCPGRVDIYSDLLIAHVWNQARVSRLFLVGLIIRCAAWVGYPVDYRTMPEYTYCSRVGADMVVDILASIPYHLGWRIDENGALKPGDLSGFASGTDNVTSSKALGGFYCIWPLLCVTSSDYATDNQRLWIRGRMNLIADVMGLNQARVIGSFLLRLPSMIVRRDLMGHMPLGTKPHQRASSTKPPAHVPITTTTISKFAEPITPSQSHQNYQSPNRHGGSSASPASTTPRASLANVHSPGQAQQDQNQSQSQQDEAMKKEEWEREIKIMLKKAANYGGENTESLIGSYLAL